MRNVFDPKKYGRLLIEAGCARLFAAKALLRRMPETEMSRYAASSAR